MASNPFFEFKTPEFQALDPFTKFLKFNEIFPTHPAFASAETQTRELMRNKVLGFNNSNELIKAIHDELQARGADPEVKSRVFNELVRDDSLYESWPLPDKQLFRSRFGAVIDPSEVSPEGPVGIPAGETLIPRPGVEVDPTLMPPEGVKTPAQPAEQFYVNPIEAVTPEFRRLAETMQGIEQTAAEQQAQELAAQRAAGVQEMQAGGPAGPGNMVIDPAAIAAPPDVMDPRMAEAVQPVSPRQILEQISGMAEQQLLPEQDTRPPYYPPETREAIQGALAGHEKALAQDPVSPSGRMGADQVLGTNAAVLNMLGDTSSAATAANQMMEANRRMIPPDFVPTEAPEIKTGLEIFSAVFDKKKREQWVNFAKENFPQTAMMYLAAAPAWAGVLASGASGAVALGTTFAAARIPESLMEAGQAYQTAIDAGDSVEEARGKASNVAIHNLPLIALDYLQGKAPGVFKDIFEQVVAGKISNKAINFLFKVGGGLVGARVSAESEAWEEMYQEALHEYEEGEPGLFRSGHTTPREEKAGAGGRAIGLMMGLPGVATSTTNAAARAMEISNEDREKLRVAITGEIDRVGKVKNLIAQSPELQAILKESKDAKEVARRTGRLEVEAKELQRIHKLMTPEELAGQAVEEPEPATSIPSEMVAPPGETPGPTVEEQLAAPPQPRPLDPVVEKLRAANMHDAANALDKAQMGEVLTPDEVAAVDNIAKAVEEGQVEPETAETVEKFRQERLATLPEVEKKSAYQEVVDAVAGGAETVEDIITAVKTDLTKDEVRQHLNAAMKAGEIDKHQPGNRRPLQYTPAGEMTRAERAAAMTPQEIDDVIVDTVVGSEAGLTAAEVQAQLAENVPLDITMQQAAAALRRLTNQDRLTKTREGNAFRYGPPPTEGQKLSEVTENLGRLPGPINAKAADLAVGDTFNMPTMDIEGATVTAIEKGERAQRKITYTTPEGQTETAVVSPRRAVQITKGPEAARVAEIVDKGTQAAAPRVAEEAAPEEAPKAPAQKRLADMEEKYRRLIDAAETPEEIDAVAEAWSQEKSKPWRAGIEREMAKKRRQLAAEARKAGAEQTEAAAPATKQKGRKKGKEPPSPFEQKVLDSIKRGNTSNTEIHNDTGLPLKRIAQATAKLIRKGQITKTQEPTGRSDKSVRNRYALVEEADQKAARKAAAEAAEAAKAEKKAAKEEAAAKPTFEKHKEEFNRILNAEEPKPDRSSERGSVELPQTEREKKNEEETNRSRDEYAKRKIADYAASGGTIVPSEKYLIEFRAKLSRGQRRAYDEMVAMVESYIIEGKHDFQVIEKILKRGSDKKNKNERAALGYALAQYLLGPEQDGLKDLNEVKKLVKDRVSKEDLDELEAIRKRNQERHKQLVESDILPEQVKERLRTKEFYFRRAYDRYLRSGEWSGRWTPFTPTDEARREAIDVVQHAFAEEVEKLSVKLHDFHGMVPKGFDFIGFFKTRDDSMLKDIPGELADKLIGLRHQIQYWGDMIEINHAASDDVVGITAVSNRLRDHAEDMVKIILEDPVTRKRAGSKLSIANLQERVLTDVFRALYGEIKDPAVLQALTVEAQGTLIAQAMFFDDLARNGRDLVWSDRPTSEQHLTERLGSMDGDVLRQDDVFRYGPLAGKYVDPLFKDFLDNAGVYQVYFSELLDFGTVTTQKLGAIWGKHFAALQGATRTMALTSLGAYTRNLLTSYLQFAMQNGDFFHPEFHGKFWGNINQARKILLNHPDALAVLAEDMRQGKFRYTQTSIVTDMAPVLQTQGSQTVRSSANTLGKMKFGLKGTTGKIKELYILMDYAAKKASFETRYNLAKKQGKSDEVANAYGKWYVETFYQNAEKVPEWINAISKLGFADFVGFKYDSGRMAINSAILARIAVSKKLRAPSPKGSWLADWKGILNEHPDLIDTWQPVVGMAAARLGGIGLFGPGQYLLGTSLAKWGVAGGSFITNACMKAFGYDDEDDKITSNNLPHQILAGLNKLKPIYDANGLGWNYGMIDKDGKKWIRFVPLNSHFGNFFEEWLMGYVQRFNVAKENPREVIEDMIRKNNAADLALGMTWSNLVTLFTGFSPDGMATPNNLWRAVDPQSGLKWTESFNEIGLAILNYTANTTGAFGRAWKKFSREESAAGRTPKPGNFFKSQGVDEDESFEFFFRFLVPVFRITRVDDYDADKMMQSAAYKLAPNAEAVAQGKYNWGTVNRAGKEWVEGATTEEQKISNKGREWTKESLRRAEAYVASVKPALEYTGVTDDEMIDLIRSKIPGGTNFSEKEAKAIVLGKVEDYINSKEFIAPDASASPIQRGDATLKELIRKDVSAETAYDAMLSEHFEVGEYDEKFIARFHKMLLEVRAGDPKLGF